MNEPLPRTTVVAARLSGGRHLIASLDPDTPEQNSPLRRHLRAETAQTPKTHSTTQQATLTAAPAEPKA